MAAYRSTIDPGTAERLMTGGLGPDDAPPGYRRLAGLCQAAAAPPGESLSSGEPIGALAAAIRNELASPTPSRRSPVLSKLVLAKLLAALSVASLSATAAGAATGHLPDSVQDKVADVAEHVGVNLPESDEADDKADHGVVRFTEGCVPAADGTFARNRGQYLKQERAKGEEALEAAKKSRCGMPIQSEGTPGADEPALTPPTAEIPPASDQADDEHGKAADEHGKAGDDHGKAGDDHGKAHKDHGKAGDEHATGRP
jgi:hypothetical protein